MKLFGFFLFALSLSFMACEGEDGAMGAMGAVGPAGPAGEQGPAGEDGRDGMDGQNGEAGNTTIIASDWYDLSWNTNPGTTGISDQDAPEITADRIENAVILGYMRIPGPNTVYLLPTHWLGNNRSINGEIQVGTYRHYYFADSSWDLPNLQGKYVIIPTEGRLAAPSDNPKQAVYDEFEAAGVDITDYDQVAKYLNIE